MNSGSPTAMVDRLARAPSLLVVSEFDGTLADFVTDPATARPVTGALDVLTALAQLPRTRAAVISGRSLDSLRGVCLPTPDGAQSCRIELIGSGGMEIEAQVTLGLTTDAQRVCRRLREAASEIAERHPGVSVDEKPYGVALHVRGVAPADAQQAIAQLLDYALSLPRQVYSQSRSDVLDLSVLPVGQDWAIDALRRGRDAVVLYAGNDERALASLSPADIGVTVGDTNVTDAVRLQNPADLVCFLNELCHSRRRVLARL